MCWQELKGGLKDYGETFNYFLMVAWMAFLVLDWDLISELDFNTALLLMWVIPQAFENIHTFSVDICAIIWMKKIY